MNTAFERNEQKDEYLTPKYITLALEPFDVDACASDVRPWDIAPVCYTRADNGLSQPWTLRGVREPGFVWCNPPYGRAAEAFMRRMREHNHGIALIFCRTETQCWQRHVFNSATSILFIAKRLCFLDRTGAETKSKKTGKRQTAGSPSALIAYGKLAHARLQRAHQAGAIAGALIRLSSNQEHTTP